MTNASPATKRRAKTGTCDRCKTEHIVEHGKLIEHTRLMINAVFTTITQRCEGTGSVPCELREKSRIRSRAKRRATVEAVRGDASVLLDAILNKRADLDNEIDRDRLLALAFVEYRLDHENARVQAGMLWVSAKKHHEIFCRFCGFLIAKLRFGGWTPLSSEHKHQIVGRHILICALQYLAGIRTPPKPGAKMYPQLGPSALFDETTRDPALPLPYLIQCPACGAAAGTACVDYASERDATPVVWSEALQLEHPHEARRIAAGLATA